MHSIEYCYKANPLLFTVHNSYAAIYVSLEEDWELCSSAE